MKPRRTAVAIPGPMPLAKAVGVLAALLIACLSGAGSREVSLSGGAGHALLFADHAVVLKPFQNFASDAFTFEAWLQTTDYCNRGAIMSYAKQSPGSSDPTPFNHFVVFDELNLIACHDYQYIDLVPDPQRVSCYSAYNRTYTASYFDRTPTWHHLAVTWTKQEGVTRIYKDGLMLAEARTGKTAPLESNGAFMLGNEQDCYGGCTDSTQAYYGLMDEVRLWKTARTQEQILNNMRRTDITENRSDLLAYWQFNDPDEDGGLHKDHSYAKDSSDNGHNLPLVSAPTRSDVTIRQNNEQFSTSAVTFANHYALNPEVTGMPDKDFTVELWVRTPAFDASAPGHNLVQDILGYATHLPRGDPTSGTDPDSVFVDDAIRIQKYYEEYRNSDVLEHLDVSTVGSISVHVNGNTDGNGQRYENWLDYALGWTDNDWHHIAVAWSHDGTLALYFDGKPRTPFWRSQKGVRDVRDPNSSGVTKSIAGGTTRHTEGSLVIGQNQECYGGCFAPQYALDGDVANVRIWKRVLSQAEVEGSRFKATPASQTDLVLMFNFAAVEISAAMDVAAGSIAPQNAKPTVGDANNALRLWGDAPRWEYSTAPLLGSDGMPVERPFAGDAGHALFLNDQQVLMHSNFKNFPTTAITVEFWMWSVDTCRDGVPFSYATDDYEKGDNTFLIFNYRNWGISVMEHEGVVADHFSGISAVDGSWHHIAVTWQSDTGRALLYDNGRQVWSVVRSKGKTLPSGGTLVVGREQDCTGGCFDSLAGSAGGLDHNLHREYGPQDFFGVIDEMRIWKTVRTPDQIKAGLNTALYRAGQKGTSNGTVDPTDPDLVAYWQFDEGKGYLIKDSTGHGHDLHATANPHWQVMRWLTHCGNGIMEGLEECDLGSLNGQNQGCTDECKIQTGWDCYPEGCRKLSPGETPRPRPPPPAGRPDSPSSAHGGGSSSGGDAQSGSGSSSSGGGISGWGWFGIVVGVATAGIAGVAILYRETLMDNFPQLGNTFDSLRSRFGGGGGGYGGLDHLDPEENLDLSPEFLGATAARHPQGPYRPLDNESQQQ